MQSGDLQTQKISLDLEDVFHLAMRAQAVVAVKIDPFVFYAIKSLEEERGLQLAKRILASRGQQPGLMRLWQEERLDISVEVLVLQTDFQSLFTKEELDTARQRLIALGYPLD